MGIEDGSVSRLLSEWTHGDNGAVERLTPLIYDELHRLAAAYMRRERKGHTLSPTALVSEAFVRMAGGELPSFRDRAHFFALAARQMRRILVDHARARAAEKRQAGGRLVTFDEALLSDERPEELCALDEALDALGALDERKGRVVELHYFGGMSRKEIASALAIHENTVARDLRMGEAWLLGHLRDGA